MRGWFKLQAPPTLPSNLKEKPATFGELCVSVTPKNFGLPPGTAPVINPPSQASPDLPSVQVPKEEPSKAPAASKAPSASAKKGNPTLELKVIEAKDLIAADKNGLFLFLPISLKGLSDPFVQVKLGPKASGKTKAIDKTLNPKWNETLTLSHKTLDASKDKLVVDLYDKDGFFDSVQDVRISYIRMMLSEL